MAFSWVILSASSWVTPASVISFASSSGASGHAESPVGVVALPD